MPSEGKKPFLPKWAQEQQERDGRTIVALTQRVAELEAALAGDGGSLFHVGSNTSPDFLSLPSSVRHMKLSLPNGFEVDIQPQSAGNGGVGTHDTVQLMVTSHHHMMVVPQAANVVHIGPRRL